MATQGSRSGRPSPWAPASSLHSHLWMCAPRAVKGLTYLEHRGQLSLDPHAWPGFWPGVPPSGAFFG